MVSLVFRDERKSTKKCWLIDVDKAEKTMGKYFNYPKGFAKAGQEEDFTYH